MLVGIDIGGTKTRIALANTPEKIEHEAVFPTPKDKSHYLTQLSNQLTILAKGTSIAAIGVACTGVNVRSGFFENLPLADHLQSQFNVPVSFANDATAGGIAEANIGAGKNHKLVLYVTISTGIGTALILDGKPLPSRFNSEGGKHIIEHSPFPGKSFESLASGKAIVEKYKTQAHEIHDSKTWEAITKDWAVGLFNLITIVQPDVVVLAGGAVTNFEAAQKPLENNLSKLPSQFPLPPVKVAKYVETAPAIGALILAEQAL